MARKIPPFAALRAFEALSRCGNLQAAGEELGVSASAISHQLKSLEIHLGFRLLIRTDNRIKLTNRGTQFALKLQQIFDRLQEAVENASGSHDKTRISINLFSSLAELWLVPLLGHFNDRHPDILISIVTIPETMELSGSDIDLAIHYGEQPPTGHGSVLLFPETIAPLCSPKFLEKHGPFASVSDLLEHCLIFCNSAPNEWSMWTEQQRVEISKDRHWLELDNRAAALQAAKSGLGIVLGRRPFADLAVAQGELVQIFPETVSTGMNYFLVVPMRSRSSSSVRAFRTWLCATVSRRNSLVVRQSAKAAVPRKLENGLRPDPTFVGQSDG